jgi:hypothetical protein
VDVADLGLGRDRARRLGERLQRCVHRSTS